MKLGRTLLIGIVGVLLAVGIERLAGFIAGRDADLCLLVSAVLTGTVTTGAIVLGCLAQLIVGVVAAYIYALIFEYVTRRAGAVIGFLVAIGHVIIAGLVVGFMPGERLLAADVMPPGAFMEYRGAVVLGGFLLAHLAFGTFVGAAYGPVLHSASPPAPQWKER